jgi:hypothetical protein
MNTVASPTNAERVATFLANKQLTDAVGVRLESGIDFEEPSGEALLQRFREHLSRRYGPVTKNEQN